MLSKKGKKFHYMRKKKNEKFQLWESSKKKKKNGNKKFKCEDGNFLVVCPLIVILELI